MPGLPPIVPRSVSRLRSLLGILSAPPELGVELRASNALYEGRGVDARPAYASPSGQFERSSPEQEAVVREAYLQGKQVGLARAPEGDVSRVSSADLAVDLNRATPAELEELLALGTQKLSSLAYFTSGAGLWSRGGGQVKALVPLNLAELLPEAALARLSHASDLVNAKTPQDVLFVAAGKGEPVVVKQGETEAAVAARLVRDAQAEIEQILSAARAHERAMPPLAMKLVNVALASRRAGTYIPFDVWTSEQTHASIAKFLDTFKTAYPGMQFHPDPEVQKQIVDALSDYFAAARAHGDTHLFGYQKGLHAMDPETGMPLPDTALIGEGAGRAKAYLDESGRTAELLRRGKREWVFENIEVFSDLPLLTGAHAKGGKDVSVVLVPQRDGYSGGSPFRVQKRDGTTNLELHEQSALPPEFATGNEFFNANTIFQPLDAAPPSGLGFEVKNNGTQVRAKQNAGDITQERPTTGIGGRVPVEYENLKTYDEFVQNGVPLMDAYRSLWSRDARPRTAAEADGPALGWAAD